MQIVARMMDDIQAAAQNSCHTCNLLFGQFNHKDIQKLENHLVLQTTYHNAHPLRRKMQRNRSINTDTLEEKNSKEIQRRCRARMGHLKRLCSQIGGGILKNQHTITYSVQHHGFV